MAERIEAVPEGSTIGMFRGVRWSVSKTTHNGGRSCKIFARELGGNDFISLNFYRTARGDRLKPCEMPEEKVVEFLRGVEMVYETESAS